jgi:hypothetical protein
LPAQKKVLIRKAANMLKLRPIVDGLRLAAVALTVWTFPPNPTISEGDSDAPPPPLRAGLFLQDPLESMAGALLLLQDFLFPTAHVSFQKGIDVAAAGLEGHT